MSPKTLQSGHEVETVSSEEQREIENSGVRFPSRMVRLLPDGWLLPDMLVHRYADKIYNFKFRPDDLVVISSPKSGTTWMQEILWTMVHNPDLTHPETDTPILNRSPDIGFDFMFSTMLAHFIKFDAFKQWFAEVCPGRHEEDGVMLQICELMPGRRIIKSHLPLALMPPDLLDTAKVVYMARNPKDVVVSYYSMMKRMDIAEYSRTFDAFVRSFMDEHFLFSPYWRHMQLAWEKRKHPNMRFIFYEDLKADVMTHLRQLNDFIGTNLTQSQLDAVAHHTSFSSMKSRGEPMKDGLFSNFFRKGEKGSWKGAFSTELLEEMDQWIERNTADIGITYKWD